MTRITTTKSIQTLTEVGRHSVGDGLYLSISPAGTKTWVFRYQLRHRRRDAGLGVFPAVSLADAKKAAFHARQLLAQDRDPIEERRTAHKPEQVLPTFGDVAGQVLADAGRMLGPKSLARLRLLLGPQYCAGLSGRPITSITTEDIADRLKEVAMTKPETAKKLHSAFAKVFDAARVTLRARHGVTLTIDPTAVKDLRALGYTRRVSHENYPALDWREAPNFMQVLRDREGIAYRALEFAVLSGVREAAVAAAEWQEVDLQEAIWTVPLGRLKDRLHRKYPLQVPLSTGALEALRRVSGLDQRWVFPGLGHGRHIAPQSMLQALKLKLNRDATGRAHWVDPDTRRPVVVHGFRASLKTFSDDHGFRHEVSELTLGHAVGSEVERSYRRTTLLDQRRHLLQAWSDHCEGRTCAEVIPLRVFAPA